MAKFLLVEDDVQMQNIIEASLHEHDFVVFGTLKEAMENLSQLEFDFALLDLHLPDGTTFEFCTELRKDARWKNIPIIFMTGDEMEASALTGFSAGADDYIVKPIKPRVFRAKILNWLKRAKDFSNDKLITSDSFQLHPASLSVTYLGDQGNEVSVPLTPIEYKLFWCLSQKPGNIRSREQLIVDVWGASAVITDRVVDQHIYFLRKKLGVVGSQIRSVYGAGYVFDQPKSDSP